MDGPEVDMDMGLGEILLRRGLLDRAKLEAAMADPQAQGTRLASYLVENGLLTSDQLALGLAEQFGVPPALEADFVRADATLRKRLVVHQAIELQTIPLFSTGRKRVAVAMANPSNVWVIDRLAFIFGAAVEPMVTSEYALARQFELLYRVRQKRKVPITVGEMPIPRQAAASTSGRASAASSPSPPTSSSVSRSSVSRSSSKSTSRSSVSRSSSKSTLLSSASRSSPKSTSPAPVTSAVSRTSPAPATSAVSPLSSSKSPSLSSSISGASSEIRPALRSHRRTSQDQPPDANGDVGAAQPVLRLAPLDPRVAARDPAAPVEIMEDALCFTPTPMTFIPPQLCDPPTPSRVLARSTLTPIVVPVTSAGAQVAVEQIRFATDQQTLSDNLFTFMRTCFAVGAMFVVSGAAAQGRFGFADGHVRPQVEQLRFSLTLPSCLRIARSRRGIFRGSPPPDGMAVQRPLWEALDTGPPKEVLVSPVIVDGQVTLLLYAQGEPGCRVSSLAADKMEQVCEAMSNSLLRLAV